MGAEPARNGHDPVSARDLDPEARRRVFGAITAAFAEHGYRDANEARLQAASGLDHDAFAALFADREDCFLQAYGYAIESTRRAIDSSLPPGASWPLRLAAGLRILMATIDAHPAEARLVLIEAERASSAIYAHHQAMLAGLAPLLQQGREFAVRDIEPPPMLDSVLPGGISYMLGAHLRRNSEAPLSTLYPDALHLLLLPYLGDAQTAEFVANAAQDILPEDTRG
jgi:AcrR family transcriptional regulator